MKHQILVTAGNTWAPLDKVRVITNIFSGETGLTIAHKLAKKGFKVSVLLGDIRINLKKFRHKNLKIIRALTFKAFYKKIKKEVKKQKYSVLIHAAAISDFYLKKPLKGKIKSKKKLKLKLNPTPKIADKIKKWDPDIILIKFKLEADIKKKKLLKTALKSKDSSKANLVIANKLPCKKQHVFYLIKSKKQYVKLKGKKTLAKKLAKILKKELT
ncbi:MAG: phosphopantothenoylcysteine decarboxylase [Candidatus Margulisbacteria bacterium]|nr:phosphopantothenoylcysteine decarboxylase [Candidatus Margulisiibacteriota bacterium]